MIFAVLGVTILIVSFAIALYSLIKEQSQYRDQEEVLKESENPKIVQSVDSDEAIKKPDVVINKRPRETYVWDQNLPKEIEQVPKIDEEREIKEIEARLAQIKSEGSEGQVAIDKKQEQSQRVSQRGNLSGSFSISDMLKEL